MAGSIELFGDGPLAWRLPAASCSARSRSSACTALVRAAGGGPWVAVGAAALMAADNLLLVHSRIATLDIYAVTAMIWAAVLYLRGRPLLAGVVIGVGACTKVGRALRAARAGAARAAAGALGRRRGGPGAHRFAICAVAAAAVVRRAAGDARRGRAAVRPDRAASWSAGACSATSATCSSTRAHQTSPHGPQGIASYPWEWLIDLKPILYLNINPQRPVPGLLQRASAGPLPGDDQPGDPAGRAAGAGDGRRGGWLASAIRGERRSSCSDSAWFAGTFVPFVLLSVIDSRTSYLYYMVIVMPGIYVAAVHLGRPPAPGLGVGRDGRDRGRRDVPVHAVAVTRGRCRHGALTTGGTPAAPTAAATGRSCRSRSRRRACASTSAGGARSCGCGASSTRRRRSAAPRSPAPCAR